MTEQMSYFETCEEYLFNRVYPLLSSPWKPYILVRIGTEQIRFGALMRAIPAVSRVTLTKYLNEMERDGFLLRTKYPDPPLRTEYSLSPLGLDILPQIASILEWGRQLN